MLKNLFFGLCLVCLSVGVGAQSVKLRKEITAEDQRQIMEKIKELFLPDVQISYSISSKDLVRSFDDLPDVESYSEAYLEQRLELIRKDSADYSTYYQLAAYYNFHDKPTDASAYYRQAYDRLDKALFGADSATYYSTRAILRMGLSDPSAIEDFDRALAINPSDSIVITMYPMILLQAGEFDRLRSMSIKGLEKGTSYRHLLYIILTLNELMDGVVKAVNDAQNQAVPRNISYTKMFNYRTIDKYARRFPNDLGIVTVREMADVFGLLMKAVSVSDQGKLKLDFDKEEQKRLQQLDKNFSSPDRLYLNEYARLRNLALIKLLRGESDTAIVLFEKAISIFPQSKSDYLLFNPGDSYDFLCAIHYQTGNFKAMEDVLKRKIAFKPEGKPNPKNYLLLAKLALQNDRIRDATYWVDKAREISSDNFEMLSLMAHLYFLSGNLSMTQFYGEEAHNYVQSTDDQYVSLTQFLLYQLWAGDAESAYDNLKKARIVKDKEPCPLCDEIEKEYLEVLPGR